MGVITKISTQTKDNERCNIYVDDEFCCSMQKIVVLQNHLFVGHEVNDMELGNLAFESEKDKAFSYAVDYICKYIPAQKQVVKKLYDKKYSKRVVDYVIEKCKSYGYIDDLKYAQNYIFQNRNIKGKIRLEQELLAKGIKKEYIDEALKDYKEESSNCLTIARKKAQNKDLENKKEYAQLVRFLQYRGYSFEDINSVISIIKSERKDD